VARRQYISQQKERISLTHCCIKGRGGKREQTTGGVLTYGGGRCTTREHGVGELGAKGKREVGEKSLPEGFKVGSGIEGLWKRWLGVGCRVGGSRLFEKGYCRERRIVRRPDIWMQQKQENTKEVKLGPWSKA